MVNFQQIFCEDFLLQVGSQAFWKYEDKAEIDEYIFWSQLDVNTMHFFSGFGKKGLYVSSILWKT